MNILDKLNQLGQKINTFFGDPDTYQEHIPLKELFSGEPLAKFLPYRTYHPGKQLFINENSFGFT